VGLQKDYIAERILDGKELISEKELILFREVKDTSAQDFWAAG